jgi:hypothetical protein
MKSNLVCAVFVIVALGGFIVWRSPITIGLKIKYGGDRNDSGMLLDAANQLLRFRGREEIARRQAAELKMRVARSEIEEARNLLDQLIKENPKVSSLLVKRAGLNEFAGRTDRALNDLSAARELSLRGDSGGRFDEPTTQQIDEMISRFHQKKF